MLRKQTLFFLAVVVAAIILMTYQGRKGRVLAGSPLSTPLHASHSAATSLADSLARPFRMMALREEDNQRLRKRVDELSLEAARMQETMLENRRLRELLHFRDARGNVVAAARVISRGMDNWSHTVVIDAGSSDGVVRDLAVVTPRGLAGKVVSVSDHYASVLLLTDITFGAAVRIQSSRKEAVLAGTGSDRCVIKYLPFEEEVKTGDVLVTSGLDGLFPKGIPVAYVSRVGGGGKGGNFQYVEAVPFQDNRKMEEVLVVR